MYLLSVQGTGNQTLTYVTLVQDEFLDRHALVAQIREGQAQAGEIGVLAANVEPLVAAADAHAGIDVLWFLGTPEPWPGWDVSTHGG